MKENDLVRIDPYWLQEGEDCLALIVLYPDYEYYISNNWGPQIACMCNCVVFWSGQFIPFHTDMFIEIVSSVDDYICEI